MNRGGLIGLVVAIVAGLAITWWSRSGDAVKNSSAIRLPAQFSATAQAGKKLFESNCAVCHGPNATGTEQGPPLVHKIYEPGHHGDPSFYRAAQLGVRQHHWPFGNMPPVPAVNRDDVTRIIAYIRELQRANGIN